MTARINSHAWRSHAVALLFAVTAFPSAARAHPALVSSVPARDATLTAAPRTLHLTFNEPVELALSQLTLEGPGDVAVALGKLGRPADSTRVIVAAIEPALPGGRYTVKWRAAGKDGHAVRGEYSFVVSVAPKGAGTIEARTQAPFDAGAPLYVMIRWVRYLALLSLIGAAVFVLVVLSRVCSLSDADGTALGAGAASRARTLACWSVGTLLVFDTARLAAQVASVGDPVALWQPAMYATVLFRTTWGNAWLLEAVAAVVALWGLTLARASWRWRVVAAAAPLLAVASALSGHAVALPERTAVAVSADALHVLGASGWIGSLLTLVLAGIPAALALGAPNAEPAVRALVEAFSPTALVFAGLLAVSGVITAWLHLGAVNDLWRSAFGQTLLVKLGVLACVAANGAYNWQRVLPSLGQPGSSLRVRRSATSELVLAAVVVAVTAVLVATPTPMEATP